MATDLGFLTCDGRLAFQAVDEMKYMPMKIYILKKLGHVEGVVWLLDYRLSLDAVMERPDPGVDLFEYVSRHGAFSKYEAHGYFRQIVRTVVGIQCRLPPL
jgi:hypothetical protein